MQASPVGTLTPSNWLAPEASPGINRTVIPHGLARSALFAGISSKSKRRVFTKEEMLASWPDVAIYQRTGKQLTQHEETIWLELIRIAMKGPAPISGQTKVPVRFTANGLSRILNPEAKPDSESRQRLLRTIEMIGDVRIRVATVKDKAEVASCSANLLDVTALHRVDDSYYEVHLDVRLANLFAGQAWSYISLVQRYALRKNPLAQWLHTHYSTHREPIDIGQEKLKKLACRVTRGDKWTKTLTIALNELSKITKWKCALSDKGMVSVDKGKAPQKPLAKPTEETSSAETSVPIETSRSPEEANTFIEWLGAQRRFTLFDICTHFKVLPKENGRLSDIELRGLVQQLWRKGASIAELTTAGEEI